MLGGSNIQGDIYYGDESYFGTPVDNKQMQFSPYRTSAYKRARGQKYGRYGSPWGNVPAELEDHLRRRTGVNAERLRYEAGLLPDADESKIGNLSPYVQDADMQLVEVRPGQWIWQGWEDDPMYKAHRLSRARERQSIARSRAQQAPQTMAPMTQGTGGYSALEALYAAHEAKPRSTTATGS